VTDIQTTEVLGLQPVSVYRYINVMIKNTGIKMGIENLNIYPKKLGILIPLSSAIDFTIKFGAFPI
jgi:hypothetical protein